MYIYQCTLNIVLVYVHPLPSPLSHIQGSNSLGRSPTGGRSLAKEFQFDHSYWSVSANDQHFTRQENVRKT